MSFKDSFDDPRLRTPEAGEQHQKAEGSCRSRPHVANDEQASPHS
jgi:hypothetical protein